MQTLTKFILTFAATGAILFGLQAAIPAVITNTIYWGVDIGEWAKQHNL